MFNLTPTTLKDLYYSNKYKSLPNFLNLWSVEDDVVVGVDLQYSVVYEITQPDLIHKTETDLEGYYLGVKNFIHSLPENTTLQFWTQVRHGDDQKIQQYIANVDVKDEFAKYIVEEKTAFLKKALPTRLKTYLTLTTYPENTDFNKVAFSAFKVINPDYKKITSQIHTNRIKQLQNMCLTLESGLSNISVKFNKMKEKELVTLFYEHLNPGRSEFHSFNKYRKDYTLRSQVVFNAVENNFDHIFVDGYFYRSINLHIRPESLGFYEIISFLNSIDPEFDYSLSINSIPQAQAERSLNMNATLAGAISNINPLKKYYEAEIKSQHSHELVEHVKTEFQKLYQISLCIIVKDNTLENLTKRTNNVTSAFRTLGESEGIIDDMNHLYNFLSVLPNNSHLNLRKHIFHTEAVARFMPLHRPWKGSADPKALMLTRNNELIGIDLFDPDLNAKHATVIGQTGSGKSYFCNYLLTNFYIQSENNHVIVIDIGGSYRKLCQLLGGEYLEIELSDKYPLNPLPPKSTAVINSSKDKFELDPDVLPFLSLLIKKLVTDDVLLSGEQKHIIETAIINTYKYTDSETPILSDLYNQFMNYETTDEQTKQIATQYGKNMQHWTMGVYGKMLNQPKSIKPDARIIVFELQKLTDDKLKEIVFFMIQNVIWNKLKNTNLRKAIFFDECWSFFASPTSAQLIEELYRTARKFNAMILSITQSPEDFFKSSASGAVIANSYVKYFLKISKGFEMLSQFQLSEPEIEDIKSLTSVRKKYSEVFLKFNQNCQVLKILSSPAEYWVCTTDPDDKNIEMKIRVDNPGIKELDLLKQLSSGGK